MKVIWAYKWFKRVISLLLMCLGFENYNEEC